MSTIQVRTDGTLKKKAQKVLKQIGLDMSSAINVYLRQIVITGSIPFPIRTVNGFTPAQERKMIREAEEAKKHGKRYGSAEELHRAILGDREYERWRSASAQRRRVKTVPARSATPQTVRKIRHQGTRYSD